MHRDLVECIARRARRNRLGKASSLGRDVLRHDPCSYCGKRGENTVDHIKPRIECKGQHNPNQMNLTAACAECNNAKGRKSLLLFLLERAS